MSKHEHDTDLHGGRLRVPRSRGALSGVLLIVLGAWGALIPLIGPAFDVGYTPDKTFDITRARFWLEILPGAVTVVGGVLLLVAANRVVTSLGAWLAVAGGAWFVVGPTLDRLLYLGTVGVPMHTSRLGSALETLLLFTGIGALILTLGGIAVGRLGVVSVRDVRAAQRREQEQAEQRADAQRTSRDDTGRTGHAGHAGHADELSARDRAELDARRRADHQAVDQPVDPAADPRTAGVTGAPDTATR